MAAGEIYPLRSTSATADACGEAAAFRGAGLPAEGTPTRCEGWLVYRRTRS